MGGNGGWFGKKDRSSPSFLVGSARYAGAPGPLDPQLAEYLQQQNAQEGQEQAQAQRPAVSSPSQGGSQAPNQPQTSAPAGGYNPPAFVPEAPITSSSGTSEQGRIPRDKQLYPYVDTQGRATVTQGGQGSGQLYPHHGGSQGGGYQVHPEPGVIQYSANSGWAGLGEGDAVVAQTGMEVGPTDGSRPVEAHEEELVRISGAMVHLIGGETSLLLTAGDFRVARITQEGKGMMAMVKVGNDTQWPLGWDEPVFKIDANRYVFTIRFTEDMEEGRPRTPSPLSQEGGDYRISSGSSYAGGDGGLGSKPDRDEEVDIMSYGITFVQGVPPEVQNSLDTCLKQYCVFSEPAVVAKGGVGSTAASSSAVPPVSSSTQAAAGPTAVLVANSSTVDAATKLEEVNAAAKMGTPGVAQGRTLSGELREDAQGLVVPTNSEERKLADATGEYWTTIAPNVDEYRTTVARGIAAGSGGMIKGIFYMSRQTSKRLEQMGNFARGRLRPSNPEKPARVSPAMMRSMRHARRLSKMTAKVADGILAGVVTTTGYFTGKIIKHTLLSSAVQKVIPGEVAIVSLEAFGKLFDAVEVAGKNVLQTTSVVTSGVVSHKYGQEAGQLATHGLAATGHMIHTAWTVSKLRKAFAPTKIGTAALTKEAVQGVRAAATTPSGK